MAERRMFSKSVIDSDPFLDMTIEAQLLYFHLAMRADDDGFITPKKIMRLIGAHDDAMRILIARRFVIPFDSGVVVIRHWRVNNYLRNDRYQETEYKDEKSKLAYKGNSPYEFKVLADSDCDGRYTTGIPQVDQRYTQNSIGKNSIGKNSIESTYTVVDQSQMDVQRTTNGQPMDRISKDKLSKDNISKDNLYYLTSAESTEKPEQQNDNPSNAPKEHSMEEPIEEVFVSFPLLGGKTVDITKKWCDEMQAIYGLGGVNVRYEILRAKKWCEDNSRYKTKWKQFLSNWFEKSVSHGGSGVPLDAFNEQNGEITQKSNQNATATQEKSERDMFNELVSSMKRNIQEIN